MTEHIISSTIFICLMLLLLLVMTGCTIGSSKKAESEVKEAEPTENLASRVEENNGEATEEPTTEAVDDSTDKEMNVTDVDMVAAPIDFSNHKMLKKVDVVNAAKEVAQG